MPVCTTFRHISIPYFTNTYTPPPPPVIGCRQPPVAIILLHAFCIYPLPSPSRQPPPIHHQFSNPLFFTSPSNNLKTMNQCYIRHDHFFILPLLPVAVAQSIRGSSSAYPYEIGGTVSAPVKIILAVLIFGMFLIAFFSLYLRKCLHDASIETHRPIEIPNNRRTRLKFPCGLDRSVVESFPVFLYSDVKVLKIGKGALECAVCISEFADDERLRFLPKCHHVFHPDCIDAWLASHTTCPVCRADLTKANLEIESGFNHELTHSQIDETTPEIGPQDHSVIHIDERAASKFPRSHSTGHSLVPIGENCERYTLRLPEEVRKQIVTLKRAKSCGCGVDLPMEGSSRRGWRGGGGGVHGGGRRWNPDRFCGKSELWNFTVTRMPVFIARSDSAGKSDPAQSSSSATVPV